MLVVTDESLEPEKLLQQLQQNSTHCGAVVTFTGKMREMGEEGRPLNRIYLEHYPVMTENSLNEIIQSAKHRFEIDEVFLCHRTGNIYRDEPIVFVGVVSKHRKAAFDAAMLIMDYLKNEAPFWKKEIYQDGEEKWVAQKQTDRDSYSSWQ